MPFLLAASLATGIGGVTSTANARGKWT